MRKDVQIRSRCGLEITVQEKILVAVYWRPNQCQTVGPRRPQAREQ